MRRNPIAFLLLLCLTLPSSVAKAQATSQPTTRDSDSSIDLYALSPDEFAKAEQANRSLEWGKIDDTIMSAAVLHETNRHRVKEGRRPLQHLAKLDEAAVLHSAHMAENRYMSHQEGEDSKHRMPIDRVRAVGLNPRFVAENIAVHAGIQHKPGRPAYPLSQWGRKGMSYRPDGDPIPPHTYATFARTIVDSWMTSPGHRENIMVGDIKFMGFACREEWPGKGKRRDNDDWHKLYSTQLFFTPMRERRN